MATCEEQIFLDLGEESLCYRPAFPVSRRVWPGSGEAKGMTVGSGAQCSMLLSQSDRLGVFSRILLGSSRWGNSEEYCYVWERLDTKFGCSAFQLTPLGPGTEDSGCSLWRTPNGSDVTGGPMDGERRLEQGHQLNLAEQAGSPKLWPTPIAKDAEEGSGRGYHLNPAADKRAGIRLREAVDRSLWPTPRKEGYDSQGKGHGDLQYEVKSRLLRSPSATDHKGKSGPNCAAIQAGNINRLSDQLGGSLNPRFVEQLMGFAVDHTDLRHWGTLLSRPRRSHSSKR